MFERFTERARQVVVLAQEEARASRCPFIDVPHLLLGLIEEEEGIGSRALRENGVEIEAARAAVEKLLFSKTPKPRSSPIPFTAEAKKVLEWTLREALSLGHNYIGTEHILMALLARNDQPSRAVFRELEVDPEKVLDHAFLLLGIKSPEQRQELCAGVRERAAKARASEIEKQSGQEEEDPKQEPEPGEGIEAIPTHQDRPAVEDELGRARLAEVLGERLRRVRGEDTEAPIGSWRARRQKRHRDSAAARSAGSFMVHVHAPWGAGKSSLLNFLAVELRNRRELNGMDWRTRAGNFLGRRAPSNPSLSQWIVVNFNAWEHQRLTPPWWWLLAAVQRSCFRELWKINRGRWAMFCIRDLGWRLWNARAAVITASLIVLTVAVGWATSWFSISIGSLTALQAVLLTVGSAITVATSLLGIAVGMGRWLAIGTAAGADRFLRRAHDPLGVYRRRFRWLVRSSGQPMAVFIDDLDRCRPDYVVELLEGIQTLFADEPIAFVVAADRTWLCQSFSQGYQEFEEAVGEAGRPLGFLFLEKTFQISTEIPPMSSDDRERFWAALLRSSAEPPSHSGEPADARPASEAFANASTQEEVEDRIGALIESGADGDEVLAAAMRRLNAPDMQEQLESLLAEFAPLLESNPRSMKRLMNAYGIERDRLLRNGRLLTKKERRQLVLLTILHMRWPLFAEHLRRFPEDTSHCTGQTRPPTDHPFGSVFKLSELRSLFDGSVVEEQLDAKTLTCFPADMAA